MSSLTEQIYEVEAILKQPAAVTYKNSSEMLFLRNQLEIMAALSVVLLRDEPPATRPTSDLLERLRNPARLGFIPYNDRYMTGYAQVVAITLEAAEEIEHLTGLLTDDAYIKTKAAHLRGHLSYANWLTEREQRKPTP